MVVDFLKHGSDDCPLIRMYKGTEKNYQDLIKEFKNLVEDKKKEFNLFLLDDIFPGIDITSLIFTCQDDEQGVEYLGEGEFKCTYKKETFRLFLTIILKYKDEGETGYFWLDDNSEIALLLSPNGQW